jgi:endogenous inhibitor of DNA gyrase (YacG/DUF329 family)
MIDTIEQTTCKACGKAITQRSGKGHRARVFCNKACKQVDYRRRHPIISNVTIESDRNVPLEREDQAQRIAELEREVETLKALRRKRSSIDVQARHTWQDRNIQWGHKLGHPSLDFQVRVKAGEKAWQSFIKEAGEDTLIRLAMAAEEYSNRDNPGGTMKGP